MNRQVWKFELALVDGPQQVSIPANAMIVHVGVQHERQVCMWAEVDPDNTHVDRRFTVVGTGHSIGANGDYVGTAIMDPFVWHVYEVASE